MGIGGANRRSARLALTAAASARRSSTSWSVPTASRSAAAT